MAMASCSSNGGKQEGRRQREGFRCLSTEECAGLFDSDGRLVKEARMRQALFEGERDRGGWSEGGCEVGVPSSSHCTFRCEQVGWTRNGGAIFGNFSSKCTQPTQHTGEGLNSPLDTCNMQSSVMYVCVCWSVGESNMETSDYCPV